MAKRTLAAEADKYDLYQVSVQRPDHEAAFFRRHFKRIFQREPVRMREDFCGTHAVCCEWVKLGKGFKAVGVDLDPEPVAWGRRHNQGWLSDEQKSRITIRLEDVRRVAGPKSDIVAAENFSYCLFKTRAELLGYFTAAYRNLAREGLFVLDVLGGSEMLQEKQEDVRAIEGRRYVKYIWEQTRFDPISHDAMFHIHYRFKDGSSLKRCFSYDWRLWMLPELRELLTEAGFVDLEVWWEGTEKATGEGNGRYTLKTHAPAEAAWVCYLLAVKR